MKKYKDSGKEDIIVRKDSISIVLDTWSFSHDKLKDSAIEYLNKEGFECIGTGKHIGVNPIIKIYEEYFKLAMRVGGGGAGLIPCQAVLLTPLNKDDR